MKKTYALRRRGGGIVPGSDYGSKGYNCSNQPLRGRQNKRGQKILGKGLMASTISKEEGKVELMLTRWRPERCEVAIAKKTKKKGNL